MADRPLLAIVSQPIPDAGRLARWQRALLVDTDPPAEDKVFLIRIALDSEGGTGRGVRIDADALAAETALWGGKTVTRRTVWRRLDPYLGVWITRVTAPAPGRAADYALTIPASCDTIQRETVTRSSDTAERGDVTRRRLSTASPAAGGGPERVTRMRYTMSHDPVENSATCDIGERENAHPSQTTSTPGVSTGRGTRARGQPSGRPPSIPSPAAPAQPAERAPSARAALRSAGVDESGRSPPLPPARARAAS